MHGEDRELDPAVGHEEQGVPRHHEHPVATAAQEALPNYRTQHDTERTLYVGNLHPFVTDSILRDVFETCGGVEEVKIVRCKVTNLSAGYGFVQFTDAKHAERALGSLHGRLLYGQELRLNWTFSRQQEDTSNHVQIFVGDLANDVNHRVLFDAFSARCANCSDARVMWDHNSGRSKGYGFVSFRTKEDAAAAIEIMNGEQIGSRRVRCGWAQHKQEEAQPVDEHTVDRADPINTNVYVGNLPPGTGDTELLALFAPFGRIVETKLYRKGGYGFVRFADHAAAVAAICDMHGHTVGDRALKCSWGRFPNGQRVKQGLGGPAPVDAGQQPSYYITPTGVGGGMPYMPAAALMPGTAMLHPSAAPMLMTTSANPAIMSAGGAGALNAAAAGMGGNAGMLGSAAGMGMDARTAGMYLSMYNPYPQRP